MAVFTEEERRAQVVAIAASQVGPQNPDAYWSVVCPALKGHAHDVAWCGGFALACLHQAFLTKKPWIIGKGFLLTSPALSTTDDPQPGDIAYFNRPVQHHAIVRQVKDGVLHTIDGNQGVSPAELVMLRERPRSMRGVTFYSIRTLILAALERDLAAAAAADPSAVDAANAPGTPASLNPAGPEPG